MPFLHSTFVRGCDHWSVDDQRNEFGETEPALCSTTYTCTHTKYKKPQITFWIPKKENVWILHTLKFWVKSKINRCADTDYITVTDTIISSGLSTESWVPKVLLNSKQHFSHKWFSKGSSRWNSIWGSLKGVPTISLTFCSQDMMSYEKLFYF